MSRESYDVTLSNVSSKESEHDVIPSSIWTDTQLITVNSDIVTSSQNTIVHVTDSVLDKSEPIISSFNRVN